MTRSKVATPHVLDGESWEKDLFGVSPEWQTSTDFCPPYASFRTSILQVMGAGRKGSSAGAWLYKYRPEKPKQGKSRDLWHEVRKHLPATPGTKYGLPEERVLLYLAIGFTSLDWWHGVDAFFHWQDKVVTLDASTRSKTRETRGKSRLKADFLLTPTSVEPRSISSLGQKIAVALQTGLVETENGSKSPIQMYHY